MLKNKPWTRKKLTEMLYHAFIGSLADNAIEIGWVLCFSLLADKILVERITVLFGVNDAFWVVFLLRVSIRNLKSQKCRIANESN